MPMHPLPILLNNGIPVTLCSDDPAVFGNMGLTFDYFQVFLASLWILSSLLTIVSQVLVSSEITGLITLRDMARNSLKVCNYFSAFYLLTASHSIQRWIPMRKTMLWLRSRDVGAYS
jgi:hypothetical protein